MIFSVFDEISYNGVKIADIFHNIGYYYDIIKSNFDLEEYRIESNDRPEMVSYKLYQDPNLYWVLFIVNDITDPFHEWMLDEEAIHETIEYRYENSGGPNVVDYHKDEQGRRYYNLVEYPIGSGNWYDQGDTNRAYLQYTGTLIPITRIEDAIDKNDEKRYINIIKPNDIDKFLELISDQIERVKKNGKNKE